MEYASLVARRKVLFGKWEYNVCRKSGRNMVKTGKKDDNLSAFRVFMIHKTE